MTTTPIEKKIEEIFRTGNYGDGIECYGDDIARLVTLYQEQLEGERERLRGIVEKTPRKKVDFSIGNMWTAKYREGWNAALKAILSKLKD